MQPTDLSIVLAQITSLTEETISMRSPRNSPTEKALADLSDKIIGLVKCILEAPDLSKDRSIRRSLLELRLEYSSLTNRSLSPEVEGKTLTVLGNIDAVRTLAIEHFSTLGGGTCTRPSNFDRGAVGESKDETLVDALPKSLAPPVVIYTTEELIDKINEGTPVKELGVKLSVMKELLRTKGESITHLDLTGIKIVSKEDLTKILSLCPNIEVLILENCSITDEMVQALALHPTTKQILVLGLADNQITIRGARELTKALNKMDPPPALRILDLSLNQIDSKTQEDILKSLEKNRPDLLVATDSNRVEFEAKIHNLSEKQSKTTDPTQTKPEYINPRLKATKLAATEDALIPLLKEIGPQLTSLDLSQITLSTEGLRTILDLCPNLRYLNAKNCGVTDAIATLIAQHPITKNIEILNLEQNLIGKDGATALAPILRESSLTWLNLSGNRITDTGAAALAGALKESKLRYLTLSHNQITDTGVETLNEGIERSSLKRLLLNGNPIRKELREKEFQLLLSINKKQPVKSLGLTEASLIALLKIHGKKTLESTHGTSERFISSLGSCISSLDLSGIELSEKGLRSILTLCPDLEYLKAENCGINDEGAVIIAAAIKENCLEEVHLRGNEITEKGAEDISGVLLTVYELRKLDLRGNLITKDMMDLIIKKSHQAKIRLTGITSEEGLSLKASSWKDLLAAPNSLKIDTLDLSGMTLTAADIKSILTIFPYITKLTANFCNIDDEAAKGLAEHPNAKNISSLSLMGNKISDEGALAVASTIKTSKITDLNLSGNQISDDGATAISREIRGSKLKNLDLRRSGGAYEVTVPITEKETALLTSINKKTPVKDLDFTESSLIALLEKYTNDVPHPIIGFHLTSLDLSGIELSAEGIRDILTLCPNLRYLKAENCGINDEGAMIIAAAIKESNIEDLHLRGNEMTDEGVAAISREIRESKLKNLDLRGNQIDRIITEKDRQLLTNINEAIPVKDLGLTKSSLISLLQTKGDTIKVLNLSGTKLSAEYIKEILTLCPNITGLIAENCRIDDDLAVVIATHPNAKNLSLLDLSGNKITDKGTTAIALHMPKVEALLLAKNQIGNAGAEEIALGMPNIKFLDLSHNRIGSAGAIQIAEVLQRFTKLNLSNNEIDDTGAKALRNKIFTMSTPIQFLDLSENDKITDQMMVTIRDTATLKKIPEFEG